jgi:F0F1-type ATP synthase membrane subunit c/vacuolar-type H+-ATPase subunit K
MITPELIHYFSAGLPIMLGCFGSSIGQGIAGFSGQEALTRQVLGSDQSFRATIIGIALIESGTIVALVTALLTLFNTPEVLNMDIAIAELGASLAVGISAAAISIAASFVVKATTHSMARQPFFSQKLFPFMLISQSIIEAPVIFGFIVSMLIRNQLNVDVDFYKSMALLAAGLVIAIGCIGPSIGQALFAHTACKSLGVNKNAYTQIFPFSLINQALIETPMIFCMLLALIICYMTIPHVAPILVSTRCLVAAITMGVSTMGVGIGIGYVSSRGCLNIAADPATYASTIRATLLAAAFTESMVIYAFVVSILLLVRP